MAVPHRSSRPVCSCIQMSLVKYCMTLYCPITRVKLRYYCSPFSSLQLLLPTRLEREGMRRIMELTVYPFWYSYLCIYLYVIRSCYNDHFLWDIVWFAVSCHVLITILQLSPFPCWGSLGQYHWSIFSPILWSPIHNATYTR